MKKSIVTFHVIVLLGEKINRQPLPTFAGGSVEKWRVFGSRARVVCLGMFPETTHVLLMDDMATEQWLMG